jgi:hypothetical protein
MSFLRSIIVFIAVLFLLIQCSKEDRFLIGKEHVGLINANTTIKDLHTIFKGDSIGVHLNSDLPKMENEKLFAAANDEYEIFAADGKKLLEIVPINLNDSLSKIKSVQIFDSRYTTELGLNLHSTFKDIFENYTINKVETTLTSATLFIDELNATIAIDKEDLGVSKFSREQITIDQIPDIAKIKYFTIWFN